MKQFWTKDETDNLIIMAAQGKTNAQIAKALGRSVGSVAHKRARLFRDAEQYITEGTAGAPEDFEEPDGEGATELKYVPELLDTAANAISNNAEILENNMATVMERVTELSQDNTILRDKAAAAEKQLALLEYVEDYLSHGAVWRLFHSFRRFMERKAMRAAKGEALTYPTGGKEYDQA